MLLTTNSNETRNLRGKPELKIVRCQLIFEIVDDAKHANSSVFYFKELNHAELNPAQTDWFVSALNIVVEPLTSSSGGNTCKN
jgi:hypothetical protein